ncbi:MAG: hypothetical protein ACTSUE_12195 [Promethearchaeota archaeon]
MCRLGGFTGSHPEILESFPSGSESFSEDEERNFLIKSLPHGIKPGMISIDKYSKNKIILSYVYEVKQEGVRNDLAAISFVVSKDNVNIEHFKKLLEILIENIKDRIDGFTKKRLKNMLERIYNGINKNKKFAIDDVIIDIPKIIKNKGITIKKEKTGGMGGDLF